MRLHQLVVWHVDKAAPAGCYDLLGNPDTRVACSSPGSPPANVPYTVKARRSQAEKAFPRAPSRLEASKVRVKSKLTSPASAGEDATKFRVSVELEAGGTWRQVWSGTIEAAIAGTFGATLWSGPRDDRALLLLTFTHVGTANGDVLTRWVKLPAP